MKLFSPSSRPIRPKIADRKLPHRRDLDLSLRTPLATLSAALLLLTPLPALADDATSPASLFARTCAACHAGGGNILGGPSLFASDLEKNGVNTTEQIYNVIYSGRRKMYGFGETCEPKGACTFGKRLTDIEVQTLAEFVKEQSEKGWKD